VETAPDVSPVGEIGTNTFETPVNQLITPAGIQIELQGMRPQALALSPENDLLVTSGQISELIVLDPATGKILQKVPFPSATLSNTAADSGSQAIPRPDAKAELSYTGLAFSPDGSRIYLSNATGDIKVFVVAKDHKVTGLFSIPLPAANAPRRKEEVPAGIAVSKDGKRLYVALNLSNRIAELDATSGRVLRLWDAGVAPFDVVLAGGKIYVSNWGGRRPDAASLTGPAGHGTVARVDPIRFIASEGSVSVINLAGKSSPAEILTGLHACAMALSPNGRFLAVANAGSDTISIVDTRTDEIIETISARQSPSDLFGAQPNGLSFDKRGKMLFVCNGTQNAIGVIRFKPRESELVGLIPVGWFPGAIVLDAAHNKLCVANIKGFNHGRVRKDGIREFNSLQWNGSLSLIRVPSSRDLARFTATALKNMRYPFIAHSKLPPRPGRVPVPVPERTGEPSVFKHVIYVIKENRTYDQMLGDMKEGNGDARLCIFGEHFTPNQHKIARQFVLLDNTYCSGAKSTDGHQWTDSAMVTEYLEKSFAGFPRSYPAGGDILTEDAIAYSPAGFLWDDALAYGKTLRDFGEFSQAYTKWKDPARKGRPSFTDIYRQFTNGTDDIAIWSEPSIGSLKPYLVTNTVGWDLNVPDVFRASQFIRDLERFEKDCALPDLMIIWLPNDHTSGTSPGTPTPAAQVADNDLAFGRIVEAVSHSRHWKDTCIFAIEDDPQSGWDHVNSFRTHAYVASAYTKRGQVIHTQYNTTSLLRTIELILGLPPMNQMDATATPMFDCFTNTPDFAPFDSMANNVPLDQMNPPAKRVADSVLRRDVYVSSHLPLKEADQCPDGVLNEIVWRAMAGSRKPYPRWAVSVQEKRD
jgi:YVTN family beta-propeller protein